jgi:hypothetical protein
MYPTINSHRDGLHLERSIALSRSHATSRQLAKVMFMVVVIAAALAVPVVAAPFV